jgi:hypothetical protein
VQGFSRTNLGSRKVQNERANQGKHFFPQITPHWQSHIFSVCNKLIQKNGCAPQVPCSILKSLTAFFCFGSAANERDFLLWCSKSQLHKSEQTVFSELQIGVRFFEFFRCAANNDSAIKTDKTTRIYASMFRCVANDDLPWRGVAKMGFLLSSFNFPNQSTNWIRSSLHRVLNFLSRLQCPTY